MHLKENLNSVFLCFVCTYTFCAISTRFIISIFSYHQKRFISKLQRFLQHGDALCYLTTCLLLGIEDFSLFPIADDTITLWRMLLIDVKVRTYNYLQDFPQEAVKGVLIFKPSESILPHCFPGQLAATLLWTCTHWGDGYVSRVLTEAFLWSPPHMVPSLWIIFPSDNHFCWKSRSNLSSPCSSRTGGGSAALSFLLPWLQKLIPFLQEKPGHSVDKERWDNRERKSR